MKVRRIPLEGDKFPNGFGLSVDALEKSFSQLDEHLKAHGWKGDLRPVESSSSPGVMSAAENVSGGHAAVMDIVQNQGKRDGTKP
jgi:hypothetical protein